MGARILDVAKTQLLLLLASTAAFARVLRGFVWNGWEGLGANRTG